MFQIAAQSLPAFGGSSTISYLSGRIVFKVCAAFLPAISSVSYTHLLYYCYRLGYLPKYKKQNNARLHYLLKDDLMKLDKITDEDML